MTTTIIESRDLEHLIAPVAAVLPTRTPLEELQTFRLEQKDGTLTASGTNGNTWVTASAEAEGDPFVAFLKGELVASVVHLLPDGPVEIVVDAKHLRIVAKHGETKLPLASEDKVVREQTFAHPIIKLGMKGKSLKRGYAAVAFAIRSDPRTFLECVVLRVTDGAMVFAGGNPTCMTEHATLGNTKQKDRVDTLILKPTMQMISKAFADAESVQFAASDKLASFKSQRVQIVTTLIAGPYAPYEGVRQRFLDQATNAVTIDRQEMLAALKSKTPFLEENQKTLLSFTEDRVTIAAENTNGRSSSDCSAQYAGEAVSIALRHEWLTNLLSAADAPQMVFRLSAAGAKQEVMVVESVYGEDSKTQYSAFIGLMKEAVA